MQSYRRTGFFRFSPSATCGITITIPTYYTRVYTGEYVSERTSLSPRLKRRERLRGASPSAVTVLFGHREFEKPSSLPNRLYSNWRRTFENFCRTNCTTRPKHGGRNAYGNGNCLSRSARAAGLYSRTTTTAIEVNVLKFSRKRYRNVRFWSILKPNFQSTTGVFRIVSRSRRKSHVEWVVSFFLCVVTAACSSQQYVFGIDQSAR